MAARAHARPRRTPGRDQSEAFAINAQGQIVGINYAASIVRCSGRTASVCVAEREDDPIGPLVKRVGFTPYAVVYQQPRPGRRSSSRPERRHPSAAGVPVGARTASATWRSYVEPRMPRRRDQRTRPDRREAVISAGGPCLSLGERENDRPRHTIRGKRSHRCRRDQRPRPDRRLEPTPRPATSTPSSGRSAAADRSVVPGRRGQRRHGCAGRAVRQPSG